MSFSVPQIDPVEESPHDKIPRSTYEISWGDVAGIFQRVELPRKSPSSRTSTKPDHHDSVPPPDGGIIFAPFCKKFDGVLPSDDEDEFNEDVSEETVLQSHQLVLDEMKAKLQAFIESKKKQQDRKKSKSASKK